MKRLLVLRPEPGASATVERARRLGLDPVAVPLFTVEPIEWEAPDAAQFDGLLLTSANAIRLAGDELHRLRGLPVHAVGEATAEAAREAGFDIASSGEAGVERLLASIEPDLKLLHLAGEHRTETPEARQTITRATVYRSKAVEAPDLSAAQGSVALVHSPRAGGRFAELLDAAGVERRSVAVAAISETAARAAGSGWQAVEAADRPSDDALLALAARLCNNSRAK
jgi:uroporphyrinogen-III synthase